MTKKPTPHPGIRARAAGIVIALLAFVAVALQLRVAWHASESYNSPTANYKQLDVQERRFAGVRACIQGRLLADQIPAGVIIGYDAGMGAPGWRPWPWEREYFRAQYVLAPTPLKFDAGPWLVVLNYACDAELRDALATGRYSRIWPTDADFPAEGERGDDRGVALALSLRPGP